MATSTSTVADANIHPSVILIRDRLHDIFPAIKIPLEIIGWHIRQSNSIETICTNFVAEILSSGNVIDPTKPSNSNQTIEPTTLSSSSINDDTLQTLYDVFNTIPHDHIQNVYNRLKNSTNPNWYDDIVNELLSYNNIKSPTTNKRSFDDINIEDGDLSNEYDRLLAILPDIDPDYAFERYLKYIEESNKSDLNGLITNLIEHGYVKVTEKLERLKNDQLKENLREPKFEIEEFLKTFPNPLEYFYDRTKTVSESYKIHAYIYLANAFSRLTSDYIKQILEINNYRFASTIKQLQEEFYKYQNKKKSNKDMNLLGIKRLNHRARAPISIPDIPDEIFYKELCYTKHEDEIIEYLTRKQEFRDEQIRIAKENGTLQTCECCCDDQLLDDDMINCDNNHRFCQTCVRNYIENNFISNGQCFFTCLNPTCKYEYPTRLMSNLLAPTLFSRLIIKIQQEELRRANIPNFEQCKYCTFGTIIDDPYERVFRCLNPECLKETCRACGESNHIPLRCDEVEKKDELDMRTFIENRVSEAMIRVCYQCKQRFYKLEGCNKMTCACGASMCYVCRQPIKGYDHFANNQRCNANDDVVKMHQEEMRLAYEEAKKAYIERHPEAKDLALKYDPQQHLTPNTSLYAPKAKRGRRRY